MKSFPVEDLREAAVEVAVLPPVIEALPSLPVIESEDEHDQENSRVITVDPGEEITPPISKIAQEEPSAFPGDGDSVTLAEPTAETQIADHDEDVAEHDIHAEERGESAEADQAAPADEDEQLAEETEDADGETGSNT